MPQEDFIPRIGRAVVDEWLATVRTLRPTPRPVAHVLTVLGFTADGPTYTFECRAAADDLTKTCAAMTVCECESGRRAKPVAADAPCPASPTGQHARRDGYLWRPVRGCAFAYADALETDVAVHDLVAEHELRRGVYFLDVRPIDGVEVELTLLAQVYTEMHAMNGSGFMPSKVTVRPTEAMRYPGFGPEVEVRELIERSLSEVDGAVELDDEMLTVTVDAQEAARQVVAWFEGNYDVPADQLSLASLPARTPSTIHMPGGIA